MQAHINRVPDCLETQGKLGMGILVCTWHMEVSLLGSEEDKAALDFLISLFTVFRKHSIFDLTNQPFCPRSG